MPVARIGVEEEFVLLDSTALVPLSAGGVLDRVKGAAPGGGTVTSEYLTCQFECATEPVGTLREAGAQLGAMRRMLSAHAPENTVIAAVGAPLAQWSAPAISASQHYDDVSTMLGQLTRQHAVNGLHVHIEVTDDEERVRALRRVRPRLPLLLALSANSPFAYGLPAGLASWRSVLIRRLPVSWAPPAFHDADDYHRTVDRLTRIGLLPSRASVSWAVRLSERYDTVEVRVADAQLRIDDALLLAALMRAIVVDGDPPESSPEACELDAAMWMAARHGMSARLFTPDGATEDAWTLVRRLLSDLRPALETLGDASFVEDHLAWIWTQGTGSDRQLRAHRSGGAAALAELFVGEAAASAH